jgi:small GTP-binding protein
MNAKRKAALVVLLAGESGVGKSEFALVNGKGFPLPRRGAPNRVRTDVLRSTIGVDFVETQRVHIDCPDSNTQHTEACKALHRTTTVDYQIWDTAGQERFRSGVTLVTRKADVVILAYDLTDRQSFDALQHYWVPSITEFLDPTLTPIFIVGTKADLLKENGGEHDRGVTFAEVDKLVDELSSTAFDANSFTEGGWQSFNVMTQISEKLVKSGYAERTIAKKTNQAPPPSPSERARGTKKRC